MATKNQLKKMVESALDNWDFDSFSDPAEAKDTKRGLEYLLTNPIDTQDVKNGDFDKLGEFAANIGNNLRG